MTSPAAAPEPFKHGDPVYVGDVPPNEANALVDTIRALRQEVGRLAHDIERHVQIASNEANARVEAEAPILCDQTYNMAPRDAAKYFEECRDGWITKCDELSAKLAAAEADKRWIPVSERLPDEFHDVDGVPTPIEVLAQYSFTESRRIIYARELNFLWRDAKMNSEECAYSHWKPLPDPAIDTAAAKQGA